VSAPAAAQQVPLGQSRDIGPVGVTGSVDNPAAGTYVVHGAGQDIWGTADSFHYLFEDVGPNEDINARATITALSGPHVWTKAGIMLRFVPEAESPHYSLFVTRGRGIAFQRRLSSIGPSLHTEVAPTATLPVQLELMRRKGYTVLNAHYEGGWHYVTSFTGLSAMNLFGLAVTSHDPSALADAAFEDVYVDTQPAATVMFVTPEIWQQEFAVGVAVPVEWTQPAGRPATLSYSLDDGQSWHDVPGCVAITTRTCTWTPSAESEAARLRIVVDDPSDRSAWNATFPLRLRSSSAGNLPAGWNSGDVGAVGAAGSTSFSAIAGQFALAGSGRDIWGPSDEFQFASTTVESEPTGTEITARVVSIENVHPWAKAGIMVRASRDPAAAHISAFVTPTAVNGVAFQRRRAPGDLSIHTAGAPITAPVWFKFIAGGGQVRGYYRQDARDSWQLLGVDTVALTTPYEAGLAVTSHADGTLAHATFDNVSVMSRSALSEHADIGNVGVPGATGTNDLERTVWGSGADIWGSADAFTYHYGTLAGDGSLTARVRSVDATHRWAKAGVMMRAGVSPTSPHVMVMRTAGMGTAMQYRAVEGGNSGMIVHFPSYFAEWVRLRRQGNQFIGEMSDDGLTWVVIGQVVLPLGDNITAGLAVTSHVRSRTTRGVFEDVVLR
jgi:hypothetical protein